MRIEPLSTDQTRQLASSREENLLNRAEEAIAGLTAGAEERATQLEEVRNLNLALNPEKEAKINERYEQKAAKLDAKLADKIGHIEEKVDSILGSLDDSQEIDISG